jgi:hypothetical protein
LAPQTFGNAAAMAPLPPALEGIRPGLAGYAQDVAGAVNTLATDQPAVQAGAETVQRLTPGGLANTFGDLVTGQTTPQELGQTALEGLPALGAVGQLVPQPGWIGGNVVSRAVSTGLEREGVPAPVSGGIGLLADVLTPDPGDAARLARHADEAPAVARGLGDLLGELPYRFGRAAQDEYGGVLGAVDGTGSPLTRAASPFMARAAQTGGERAFDIAAGTAGGIAGAATAPEDATWRERAGRGLVGSALGAVGGANLRQLGRVAGRALGPQAAEAAVTGIAQGAGRAADQINPEDVPLNQTVRETLDRILESQTPGAVPKAPSSELERAITGNRSRFYSAVFDQGEPLRQVQQVIEREVGRPLTEAEDAYLQYRLLAGRGDAAAQHIKDNLLPALEGLNKDDERILNQYLAAADNSDKGASVGARVAAETLQAQAPALRHATDLFRESQWAQSADTAAAARVEGLAQRWDELQEQLGRVDTHLALLREGAPQAIERPPWARAAGRGQRSMSDADLIEIASRSGVDPYRPQWYEALDPEAVRMYRSEVMAQGGGLGQTPTGLRATAARLRGERREVQQALRAFDPEMERALIAQSDAGQAVTRTAAAPGVLPALVRSAERAGQTATENRLFSGGARYQPLPDVQADLIAQHGPERAQRIFDAAQGVWDFGSSLRRRLLDSGAISQETFDAWERDFPHYVRTDVLDFLPDVNGQGGRVNAGGPMFSVSDLGVRRLSTAGTTRARDLPLNSMLRQAFSVEGVARRNEGANALYNLRQLSPELQRLIQPAQEGVPKRADQEYLSVFRNGEQQRFVGPKDIVNGLSRFNGEARNAVVDAAGTIMGAPLLRQTATGLNALFIPKNVIRDGWGYMLRNGGFSDPRAFKRSAGQLARAYWDSFAKGEADPDLAEMMRAGGGQAHEFFNLSPTQIMGRLRRDGNLGGLVRPVTNAKDLIGAAGDVLTLPFEPIRHVGAAVERAPRLATYRMARKMGQSPERAALAARDITMDFSRGGKYTKVINQLIPFFNVGVQSPERLITQDFAKGNRLKTGIGLTTSVLLPSLAAEAWNRSQYPEDYANVPDYLKDSGLVVMLPVDPPAKEDGTPGQRPYLWLPMPQQYAFLKVLQDQAVASAVGDDTRGWDDVLNSVLSGFSPLGEDASVGLLPPVPRLGAELASNYDYFRRRPIVPEKYQGLPPEEQATPTTSALARGIGGVTGRLPGEMGPAKVDYAIKSLTSGVGQQILGGTDAVARAFGLPAPEPQAAGAIDLPVVGGLAGTVLRNTGGQTDRDAYAYLDRQKQQTLRDQLELLHYSPGWATASPQQRDQLQLRVASRVEQAYADRYKAVAAGNAQAVLAQPVAQP